MPQHTASEYRNLLRDYQELQLRVTRFAHIEQQLRNTQDKLDHEIILYRRLSTFGAKAFNSKNPSSCLQLAVEAIVDILEIETGAIILSEITTSNELYFLEGFGHDSSEEQFFSDIKRLSNTINPKRSALLKESQLRHFDALQHYADGMFYHVYDAQLGISLYLVGLVSSTKAPLYEKLYNKHQIIFDLFAQQILSILTTLFQNNKIQDQVSTIAKSEIELRKLSLIAKRTKNGVIITDHNQVIEWVNESFTKSTGFSFEEVVGRKSHEMLNLHSVNYVDRKRIMQAIRNSENIELKIKSITRWGAVFYSQIETIPVHNDQGELINYIFVFKDITDETKFKNEILRINSRFQLIVNEAQVGIWEWNKALDKSYWNEVLLSQYAIESAEQEINYYEVWKASIYPDDLAYVMEGRSKVTSGAIDSIKQQYRIVNRKGEIRYINAQTIAEKDNLGNLTALVGSFIDVTDLVTIDEKVSKLKLFYENILNNLPSQVLVLNEKSELVYLNQAMAEANPCFLDYLGMSIHTDLAKCNQTNTVLSNLRKYSAIAIDGGQTVTYNETLLLKRKRLALLATALPVWLGANHVHIIVSFADVTQLNKYQKDLMRNNTELQKVNSELDNFVYRVSHDLRSPLLSIKGILGLLETEPLSEEMQEYHGLILDSATRMDSSIKDILEYSRNSRLEVKKERLDIKKMVEEIFNDTKYSTSLPISLEFTPDCEQYLISDALRISVLLKNLIGNSVKYRRDIPHSFVRFDMTTRRNMVIITLTDNGKGIAKKKINKVFEMFYRGSSDSLGTGLGLYICREIIGKLKGKISLESTLNEGTQVCIQLPLNNSKG